jgi:hypothetical protein
MANETRDVRNVNADAELPTFYANNVETMVSPWDIRFRFGQLERADEKEVAVKNNVIVYMSIEHARLFRDKLTEMIDKWDEVSAKGKP